MYIIHNEITCIMKIFHICTVAFGNWRIMSWPVSSDANGANPKASSIDQSKFKGNCVFIVCILSLCMWQYVHNITSVICVLCTWLCTHEFEKETNCNCMSVRITMHNQFIKLYAVSKWFTTYNGCQPSTPMVFATKIVSMPPCVYIT